MLNNEPTISFGDNVRVRATPLTHELELADMVGQVYGETTPSVTNVKVIGEIQEDYAINVFFDDQKESFWFAPELLELIDHAPGTEIRLDGVPKKWVRTASGEWAESNIEDSENVRKPWWKFW
jgi:hypothetical protein